MKSIFLPNEEGVLERYTIKSRTAWSPPKRRFQSRTAFAAAHVVANPWVDGDPASDCHIDWEQTLAYRRHLWSYGFGVAEAMDTAQRGMGLTWSASRELISRSVSEARAMKASIACGAGTDQLVVDSKTSLLDVQRAYEEQCGFIEAAGGQVILMASRSLAALARGPEDYARVYGAILDQVSRPVILHWLGDMFDPHLRGYWGHSDIASAMDVCLGIIQEHSSMVDGIKISLLDANYEIEMRRSLPEHVQMYTGDDFHYTDLILGDSQGYSHALLGILDAIAPVACAALHALDDGDITEYRQMLDPTVPLSRHIFCSPTRYYKTGIVFLAYLNGFQSHFRMVGGLESMRSVQHLVQLFKLADQADLLVDPEMAYQRMDSFLKVSGVV